jgi:hypothetical protein
MSKAMERRFATAKLDGINDKSGGHRKAGIDRLRRSRDQH